MAPVATINGDIIIVIIIIITIIDADNHYLIKVAPVYHVLFGSVRFGCLTLVYSLAAIDRFAPPRRRFLYFPHCPRALTRFVCSLCD